MRRTDLEYARARLGRLGWIGDQGIGEAIGLASGHNRAPHTAIETVVGPLAAWPEELDPDGREQ
jgi:hypothetical protein